MVKLKWYGHASFLITADNGLKIITDPYEPGGYDGAIGYGEIPDTPDIVLCSHDHADHGYTKGLKGEFEVVNKSGVTVVKGIEFKGVEAYHDTEEGQQRGTIIIYTFAIDGVNICHLGDLGHEIDDALAEKIGDVDVLLIPVGGMFTINGNVADRVIEKINPKIVIPMHYKTDKCGFPLARIEEFIDRKRNVSLMATDEIAITKETLPKNQMIMLLDHAL